jgi:hypothetical protein
LYLAIVPTTPAIHEAKLLDGLFHILRNERFPDQ